VPVQIAAVSSLLFGFCLLLVLVGLYLWARRRASSIKEQAAQREQAAMAMMLSSASSGDKPRKETAAASPPAADEIDHAALIRQAHGLAAQGGAGAQGSHSLPPIDYEQNTPPAERELSPAELAAAGLDPIEELISQIMVDEPSRPPSPRVAPPAPVERKRARAGARSAPREGSPMLDSMAPSVPLRELVLAWYESRGYRQVPASPAVWPIELVLRHRDDPARAYAFVVQNDNVSVDRITALIEQAREIGMLRVAVIAEAGYERGAKEIARKRNVRLIDRPTMDAELSELQLETAAKIIAVARKRASPEASAA
jgi:hypothetical protein